MAWNHENPNSLLKYVENLQASIYTPMMRDLDEKRNVSDFPQEKRVFMDPTGLFADSKENVYVADRANHMIKKIDKDGTVTVIGGNGKRGFADGPGSQAMFNEPTGVVVDPEGNVYVSDCFNHRIRKIYSNTGYVVTLAGSTKGFTEGEGTLAKFNSPFQLVLDLNKNLYVTDYENHRIRRISPEGMVSTLAGQETAGKVDGSLAEAKFNNPMGLTHDSEGNMYISERHGIRKISAQGVVSSIAGRSEESEGDGDGIGTNAKFNMPVGLAVDIGGNMLVADRMNGKIRVVSPEGKVGSIKEQFTRPNGIAIDLNGVIYLSLGNHKVKKIV